jgi:threonyl-tRNA synthetase
MSTISVSLPDGSIKELASGATGLDLAASIGPRLAKAALAVEVNDELLDLASPLSDGARVAVVTPASDHGRELLRHSTALPKR